MFRHIIFLLALLLITSCSNKAEQREVVTGTGTYTVPMPTDGTYADDQHGKEIFFAITPLEPIADAKVNGVAQAHQYADRTFRLAIQVNVLPAAEGQYYEAWLLNPETKQLFSIGHLQNRFGDARHSLQRDIRRDLQAYTEVQISLESDDGNEAQGEVLASGGLTKRERNH